MKVSIPRTAPIPNDRQKPVEAALVASSVFFAPSLRESMLPHMKATACNMVMKLNTMPVAPLWLVPSVPTKAVSTML